MKLLRMVNLRSQTMLTIDGPGTKPGEACYLSSITGRRPEVHKYPPVATRVYCEFPTAI